MDEPRPIRLGSYVFRIEEDVFFVCAVGDVTVEIAQGVVLLLRQVQERHGRIFMIGDLKDAGTIPPDSRRILVDFGSNNPPLAIAFYGVGLMVRGVNALLFGAAKLTWQTAPKHTAV